MKTKITVSVILLLILGAGSMIFAQDRSSVVPYKNLSSPVYGTDVIMLNNPGQDQTKAAIAVASNGWLYSCIAIGSGGYYVMRSVDDGQNWTSSAIQYADYIFTNLDIVVTGNDVSSFKVFVAYTCYLIADPTYWYANINEFNSDFSSFVFHTLESSITSYGYGGIKIATDAPFPASGSSPFSLGVIVTRNTSADSKALYYVSTDGGVSFTMQEIFASTAYFFSKVSIAYARSNTYNAGRYFFAFQMCNGWLVENGWISVYYTTSTVSSTITGMATFGIEDLRNPSIVCQFNDLDNSNGEFTVIFFAEKDISGGAGTAYDLYGYFNKTPITNGFGFTEFQIASSSSNTIQADANFDPGYNNFLLTYCELEAQKLLYKVNSQELTDPAGWTTISAGYNDQADLLSPWPKVEINPVKLQVAHVWTANPGWANGVGLFDAEYSVVGIEDSGNQGGLSHFVYPNPVRDIATISLMLDKSGPVKITLYNVFGKKVIETGSENMAAGRHLTNIDMKNLPAGYYLYEITTTSGISSGRLILE